MVWGSYNQDCVVFRCRGATRKQHHEKTNKKNESDFHHTQSRLTPSNEPRRACDAARARGLTASIGDGSGALLDEAAARRGAGAFRLRMIGRFGDLFRLGFR